LYILVAIDTSDPEQAFDTLKLLTTRVNEAGSLSSIAEAIATCGSWRAYSDAARLFDDFDRGLRNALQRRKLPALFRGKARIKYYGNDTVAAARKNLHLELHGPGVLDGFPCCNDHQSLRVPQGVMAFLLPVIACGEFGTIQEALVPEVAKPFCKADSVEPTTGPVVGDKKVVAPIPARNPS